MIVFGFYIIYYDSLQTLTSFFHSLVLLRLDQLIYSTQRMSDFQENEHITIEGWAVTPEDIL